MDMVMDISGTRLLLPKTFRGASAELLTSAAAPRLLRGPSQQPIRRLGFVVLSRCTLFVIPGTVSFLCAARGDSC